MSANYVCPLCGDKNSAPFHRDKRRPYLRCLNCALVFVPPEYRLSPTAEKAEYDLHQNGPQDEGYRRFLSRLVDPLAASLSGPSRGLDFGSGPGPALHLMLEAHGHAMDLYDPFYAPDSTVFDRRFHFITATEVVEHLHEPGMELERLWGMLEDAGTLAVMTKLVIDAQAFSNWHYKNDPTHVCFFSRQTWEWWAEGRGARLSFHGADVVLLKRHSGSMLR